MLTLARSLVSVLHCVIGPAQIAVVVWTVVVYAVYGETVRAWAESGEHVLLKGYVVGNPLRPDADTPAAVVRIGEVVRVKEPLLDVDPRPIEFRPAVCVRAKFWSFRATSQVFPMQAPARSDQSIIQLQQPNRCGVAAGTLAVDAPDWCASIDEWFSFGNYSQASEYHACLDIRSVLGWFAFQSQSALAPATSGATIPQTHQPQHFASSAHALALETSDASSTRSFLFDFTYDGQKSEDRTALNVQAFAHKNTNYLTKQAVV